MQAPHAIQTLRFELVADAVPLARRLPEQFSALCRRQLAVVLEEELAAHCPPHQQLRLPQLLLELPAVAHHRLEADLPDLLRQALRMALAQLGAGGPATSTITPEATAWLDVLAHFLRHGRLPWQVAAGSFSLDEVLRSLAEHQAPALRALLVRLGQTAPGRQRLVWQLNSDQLQLLLEVLEPTHAPFLHAYVLATLAAHRRQPLASVTATALRGIMYELVLADLLLHAGTAFNRRAFLERQVRQLAAQYNLSFAELLRQLVAAELAMTPRTQSALSVLLNELHQRYQPVDLPAGADTDAPRLARPVLGQGKSEATSPSGLRRATLEAQAAAAAPLTAAAYAIAETPAAPTGPETDSAPDSAPDFTANPAGALAYFLQHGSLPVAAPMPSEQQLLGAFPAWLAQGWRGLRPALQAGGPAALHRLARLLPEPLLLQLLRLAVPGQVRPVRGVMDSIWQLPATRAGGNTWPDLWALTFTYLLRDDFRSFSSPEFQQWLAQQLAGPRSGQTAGQAAGQAVDFGQPPTATGTLATGKPAAASVTPGGTNLLATERAAAADNTWSTDESALAGTAFSSSNASGGANATSLGEVAGAGNNFAAQPTPGADEVFTGSSLAAARHILPAADQPVVAAASATTATPAANGPVGHALTLAQAQEVIQHQLADGVPPPWWPGRTASPARLRALLAQVLRAGPLPDFLRTQPLSPDAQQQLVALADFTQLAGILAARGISTGSAPVAAALAALERREATGTAGWLRLLRAAYLHFYLGGGHPAAGSMRSEIQRLAAIYQLPLPATMGKIRRWLAGRPALLSDDFLAALNQLVAVPVAARASTPLGKRDQAAQASRPVEHFSPTSRPGIQADDASQPEPQNNQPGPQDGRPGPQAAQPGLQNGQPESWHGQPGSQDGQPGSQDGRPESWKGQPGSQDRRPESWKGQPAEPHDSVAEQLTELPTGVAARDLVFYLLRYQRAPWWAPAGLTLAQQRQLLTRVAQQYRAGLQALVQAHGREPEFRQALAGLASFAQLARFVSRPGPAAPGRLAPAVLAALDQQLARAAEPVARLLRQAYLTAAFHANPADIRTLAAGVRRQATRAGTSWRTVLRYVAWLHRQLPTLATAPFFAALLAAAVTDESAAGPPRLVGRRPRPRATSPAHSQSAAAAFQELEQYLRTGQASTFAATGPAASTADGAAAFADGRPATDQAATNASAVAASRGAGAVLQRLAAQWQLLLRPEHRPAWQPLRPLLASGTVRARLLASLGEAGFWLLLRQLYPGHYRLAFRLATDWQLLARQGLVKLNALALFEVLLTLIQATPAASWRPGAAVQALLAAEEALWPQAAAKRGHSRAGQLLAAIGRRGLVLRGPLGALLTLHHQAGQPARPTPPATPIPFRNEEDRPMETVYLENAGLVLLWPFLTMLFDRLGYLENQQFRDEASRQRAALVLQFLASGTPAAPEYQLPLNKLLCGIPQGEPLPARVELSTDETELGESLLRAVIARWEILKSTSIAGLRETFLLRAGKLEWLPDDRIVLTVEPKTVDILLDQRPWSISIIKLPWMAAPLYVTWR